MNNLIVAVITSLATLTNAVPGGSHGGIVLSGPSGIVTNQGAIGPAALGLGGLGAYGGHSGAYVGGPAGPSAFVGGPVGPSAFLGGPVGSPALLAGPALSHASVLRPAAGFGGSGLGLGLGGLGGLPGGYGAFGGYGGYRSGIGFAPGVAVTNGGGTVDVGLHGVTVKGPATVPATIAGPAGKVVANGLYGVPSHGHGW